MKTAAVFLTLAVTLLAEKPHAGETAKVISQNLGSEQAGAYAAPIGGGAVAVPLYRRWNVVVVETEQYRYEWHEQGRSAIILTLNDDVRFYRDGNWFIVLDSNNKKHKFALTSSVKK